MERVYSEGQEIYPGVRVERILEKSILVTTVARRYEFPLSGTSRDQQDTELDPNLIFISTKLAKYPDRNSPDFINKLLEYIDGRQLAAVDFPLGVSSYGIHAVEEQNYVVNLAAIQDQVSSAKPFQHITYDFKQEALTIKRVVPGSLYDRSGLKPGDHIIAIQDKKVTGLWDIAHAYQALRQGSDLKLSIDRNGVHKEFSYQVY
jgi:hypothetical protein